MKGAPVSTRKRLLESWSVTYTSWPGATALTSPRTPSFPAICRGPHSCGPSHPRTSGRNTSQNPSWQCLKGWWRPPPTGYRKTAGAVGGAADLCCCYQAACGAFLLAFTAATTSSVASMTSGGDGGEQGGVVFHWLLHGGHQVGLLAVQGPQLVGLVDEEPHILVVVFTQHDAELSR